MRRNILWVLMVITAALIQTTWLDTIRVQGVLPDLTLLLLVYFALLEGEERAMFTGVLGGLYQDVAGNTLLGHHILAYVAVGYLAGRLTQRLITEHPAVKVGVVLCASVLYGILFTGVQYVQTPDMPALHRILATVVPEAFYTALVTPVVFFLLSRPFRIEQETLQGEAP
jgi:rod shape-determining protein MreD